MPRTPQQRIAALAQELADEAVVIEGLSNRLRALGCKEQAAHAVAAARTLALLPRALIGTNAEAYNLFFHRVGEGAPPNNGQ